jgi:peptidoglycan hydrolase-like protein with peptidoglycan-binding domain
MTRSSVKGRMPHVLGSAALAVALAAGMAGVSASPAGAAAGRPAVTPAPYALTAATGQAWPELRQGSNSAWPQVTVRSLQYLLNAHGARLTVDGVFGPKTKAAVVAFQHAKGLSASGVVQASTWRSLVVTVHRGSAGPAVRAVQDQINFRNLKDGRRWPSTACSGRRPRRRSGPSRRRWPPRRAASGSTASSGCRPGGRWSARRCPANRGPAE